MNYIFKILQKILNRLSGKRWICEHCGDIVYSRVQPLCKPCCHIHRGNVKMFKIKNKCCGK